MPPQVRKIKADKIKSAKKDKDKKPLPTKVKGGKRDIQHGFHGTDIGYSTVGSRKRKTKGVKK